MRTAWPRCEPMTRFC